MRVRIKSLINDNDNIDSLKNLVLNKYANRGYFTPTDDESYVLKLITSQYGSIFSMTTEINDLEHIFNKYVTNHYRRDCYESSMDEVMQMVNDNPSMLLVPIKIKFYDLEMNATLFEFALKTLDISLCEKLEKLFDRVPNGSVEKQLLFSRVFPDGLAAYFDNYDNHHFMNLFDIRADNDYESNFAKELKQYKSNLKREFSTSHDRIIPCLNMFSFIAILKLYFREPRIPKQSFTHGVDLQCQLEYFFLGNETNSIFSALPDSDRKDLKRIRFAFNRLIGVLHDVGFKSYSIRTNKSIHLHTDEGYPAWLYADFIYFFKFLNGCYKTFHPARLYAFPILAKPSDDSKFDAKCTITKELCRFAFSKIDSIANDITKRITRPQKILNNDFSCYCAIM